MTVHIGGGFDWSAAAAGLNALVAAVATYFALRAWRSSEAIRLDSRMPIVIPENLKWNDAPRAPDLAQLRLSFRNDGGGPALNLWAGVTYGGHVSEWGPGAIAVTGHMDWAVAQGPDWADASSGTVDVFFEYDDVYGRHFRVTARHESAFVTGFSGGWFTDVIVRRIPTQSTHARSKDIHA